MVSVSSRSWTASSGADIRTAVKVRGGGFFFEGGNWEIAAGDTRFLGTITFNSGTLGAGFYRDSFDYYTASRYDGFQELDLDFSRVNLFASIIAPLGGNVPEPATWSLLIAGFGLVGGAMRRRVAQLRV